MSRAIPRDGWPGEAGVPVDLRADGVLWRINRSIFHPVGYALALDPATGALRLLGDGTETWSYAPDPAPGESEDDKMRAFAELLARAAMSNT